MKSPYVFKKKFVNFRASWDFLKYLSSNYTDKSDLKLELKNNIVKITLEEENHILSQLIEDYFDKSRSSTAVTVRLFCDGGSRGNPGPGACGFVFLDQADKQIGQGGKFFKYCTNNQAEYWSLKKGVAAALEKGIKVLDIYMDSQLVVKQIKGEYKVRNKDLMQLYQSIKSDLARLESYKISYIPRSHNRLADQLVNQILDQNL